MYMRKYIVIISATLLLSACNNNSNEPEEKTDTTTIQGWEAGLNDSTGKLELKRTDQAGPDSLTASSVVDFLNKKYPHVQLRWIRNSGDTIYISIPEANYLTQQMGSSGPEVYFADAVYNLTEIPGIHYINFDFQEGDHASPATMNRDSFKGE